MSPRSAALALAMVLALAVQARAEAPPTFNPNTHVYVVPAGWTPPGVSAAGLAQIEATAARLHYPFYVVIDRGDGSTGGDARTVEIAQAWIEQGFDSSGSQLFVLSYQPKFYRLHIGDRLKPNAGIDDSKVREFADIFKDRVNVGGVKDPAGAIQAVMEAVDPVFFDANDPAKLAERLAARAEADRIRKLTTAREQLAAAIGQLNGVLFDQRYLAGVPGEKLDAARQAIARARTIQDGNDAEAMLAMVSAIEPQQKAIASVVDEARWQHTKASLWGVAKTVFWLLLIGAIVVLSLRRRSRLNDKREEFRVAHAEWSEKVTRALARYVDFHDRGEMVALKGKTGKTAALLSTVMRLVDEVYVATKAMESRLAVLKEQADSATFFNPTPVYTALDGLDQVFTFNTGEVQDKLFEKETKDVAITPADFERVYGAKYEEAKAGWQKLVSSARDALTPAAEYLKDDSFVEEAAGLRDLPVPVSEALYSGHSFFGGTADLDKLRESDPIAYVEQLYVVHQNDRQIAARVRRFAAAVNGAFNFVGVEIPDRINTVLTDAQDPSLTMKLVGEAQGALRKMCAEGASIEAVETQVGHISDLVREARGRVQAVVDAFDGAQRKIEDAEALLGTVRGKLDLAHARLQVAAKTHVKLPTLDAGQNGFIDAERLIKRARQCLSQRRHFEAYTTAQSAIDRARNAITAFTKVVTDCDELDRVKADYERRLAAVKAPRSGRHGYTPPAYQGPAVVVVDRPVDYTMLQMEVAAHERRIAEEQRAADRRYEEAQEAERRARRAAEEAEERSRRSYSSGSSSWGSSGGGSYSSGGDSWGSSSSSGGSYSSGGDSW